MRVQGKIVALFFPFHCATVALSAVFFFSPLLLPVAPIPSLPPTPFPHGTSLHSGN